MISIAVFSQLHDDVISFSKLIWTWAENSTILCHAWRVDVKRLIYAWNEKNKSQRFCKTLKTIKSRGKKTATTHVRNQVAVAGKACAHARATCRPNEREIKKEYIKKSERAKNHRRGPKITERERDRETAVSRLPGRSRRVHWMRAEPRSRRDNASPTVPGG